MSRRPGPDRDEPAGRTRGRARASAERVAVFEQLGGVLAKQSTDTLKRMFQYLSLQDNVAVSATSHMLHNVHGEAVAEGPAVCRRWLEDFVAQLRGLRAKLRQLRPPAGATAPQPLNEVTAALVPFKPFRYRDTPTTHQIRAYFDGLSPSVGDESKAAARRALFPGWPVMARLAAEGRAWEVAVAHVFEHKDRAGDSPALSSLLQGRLGANPDDSTVIDHTVRAILEEEDDLGLARLVLLFLAADRIPYALWRDEYPMLPLYELTLAWFRFFLFPEAEGGLVAALQSQTRHPSARSTAAAGLIFNLTVMRSVTRTDDTRPYTDEASRYYTLDDTLRNHPELGVPRGRVDYPKLVFELFD